MNLVAKEFVACRTKNPGVLILSPFAGAGETMQEALDTDAVLFGAVGGPHHDHLRGRQQVWRSLPHHTHTNHW